MYNLTNLMSFLFTGASGFLGSHILSLLERKYVISTVGLTPKDDYKVDIARNIPAFKESFDIVFMPQEKRILCLKQKKRNRPFLM